MQRLGFTYGIRLAGLALWLAACEAPEGAGGTPSALAVLGATETSVTLTWKDNAGNEASFLVERSDVSADSDFNQVASGLSVNTTRYKDTTVQQGLTYWYRVSAVFRNGQKATSRVLEVLVDGATSAPLAPRALAVKSLSSAQVHLTWNDDATNEVGFTVERALDPAGSWEEAMVLKANTAEWIDSSLTRSTTYYYRVKAFNAAGESDYTATVSVTTFDADDFAPPSIPEGVTVSPRSSSQLEIKWNPSSDDVSGVAGYRVYVSEMLIKTLGESETSFIDSFLAANSEYCYAIEAFDKVGNASERSQITCGMTGEQAQLPALPVGLTATAVSFSQINLSWTDTANNETGFQVERAFTQDGPFVVIQKLAPDATTYQDTALDPNTVYYYRVAAFNDGGFSDYATVSQATPPPPPVDPSNLALTLQNNGTPNTIRVSWTDNADNEMAYEIEQSVNGGTFARVATAGMVNGTGGTGANNRAELNTANAYAYRVRATNGGGASAYIGPMSAPAFPTPPAAPSDVVVTQITNTTITLAWKDNSTNETGFRVERSNNPNNGYQLLSNNQGRSVGADVTSYTATGLTANTNYYFRVRSTTGTTGASSAQVVPNNNMGVRTMADGGVFNLDAGVSQTDAGSPDGGM